MQRRRKEPDGPDGLEARGGHTYDALLAQAWDFLQCEIHAGWKRAVHLGAPAEWATKWREEQLRLVAEIRRLTTAVLATAKAAALATLRTGETQQPDRQLAARKPLLLTVVR